MIVAEAANETEGLDRTAALKPHLVLLDLALPGSRLAELIRDIREASAQARLIGMTYDEMHALRARAMDCGVDYFVPIDPLGHTELVAIVNAMQPGPAHH